MMSNGAISTERDKTIESYDSRSRAEAETSSIEIMDGNEERVGDWQSRDDVSAAYADPTEQRDAMEAGIASLAGICIIVICIIVSKRLLPALLEAKSLMMSSNDGRGTEDKDGCTLGTSVAAGPGGDDVAPP
ncbi:unnamed protein product [Boreogadus saida]